MADVRDLDLRLSNTFTPSAISLWGLAYNYQYACNYNVGPSASGTRTYIMITENNGDIITYFGGSDLYCVAHYDDDPEHMIFDWVYTWYGNGVYQYIDITFTTSSTNTNFDNSLFEALFSYGMYGDGNNITIPLNRVTITPIPNQIYNGNAITPTLTVSYNNESLSDDDYYFTKTYSNNTNAGTATITLNAHYYTKSYTTTYFIIEPKQLDKPIVTLSANRLVWIAVENATSYNVYKNGTLLTNTTNLYYILTVEDTYQVQAISSNTNYSESLLSTEQVYSILVLTSRHYRQNMSWSLIPVNKIDTVVLSPISNVLGEESPIATEEFTSVKIVGQSSSTSLPLSPDVAPTYHRYMYNKYTNDVYAKARTECVMVTGEKTITLQTPIVGVPRAEISFEGTSESIDNLSYDDYPTTGNMRNANYSMATWLHNQNISTSNTLKHTYENNSFDINPWVNKVISIGNEPAFWIQLPPNDPSVLRTQWASNAFLNNTPKYSAWYEESTNFDLNNYTQYRMASTLEGDGEQRENNCLKIRDVKFQYYVRVQKINDYTIKINFQIPARFLYSAVSRRWAPIVGFNNIGSNCYADYVTKVTVNVYAQTLNTDNYEISYALDSNGNLTTDQVPNTNVFRINNNEIITLGSLYNNQNWCETIANMLLNTYKKGKYQVECDVSAIYVLQNNLKINSILQIKLQNGTYINRKGIVCNFLVKNITKKYKNSEFIYNLKLLEV